MTPSSLAELSQWNRAISACARQTHWMLSLQLRIALVVGWWWITKSGLTESNTWAYYDSICHHMPLFAVILWWDMRMFFSQVDAEAAKLWRWVPTLVVLFLLPAQHIDQAKHRYYLYIRPKKIPLLLLDDTVVLGWAVQANLQQVTAYTRSKWRHHPNERHQCMWQRQFLAAGDSFILLVERFCGSERHHVHNFDECSQHKGWMATVPLPLPILPCSTLTESLFMASGSLSHGFTDAPWHPKLSYLNWWHSKQIEHIWKQ